MHQATRTLSIATRGRGLSEFTNDAERFVRDQDIATGLLTVFCRHTSASLTIQENADPDVCADLERFFARLVKDGDPLFAHTQEGDDDMPAHVRTALTQTQLTIPIVAGRMVLGTWQGLYLWEHRSAAHRREVVLHVIGE